MRATARVGAVSTPVDVVVVAYRSAATLAACLRSTDGVPGRAAVVVVDHGDDGSAQVAEDLGAQALRNPANPGFGAGQNQGAAQGTAPYLLLLNPDAEVEPGAVAAGVALLDREPSVAAVQGRILGRDGQPERSHGRALSPVHLAGRAVAAKALLRWSVVRRASRAVPLLADSVDRRIAEATDVESLAATAILIRREAFESVGGFDEGYFLYGEDNDLCNRLRAAGWRLVALPLGWATHADGASSGSWVDRELAWWEGTLTYAWRWWGPVGRGGALAAALLMWARLVVARPSAAGTAFRRVLLSPVQRGRRIRRSAASAASVGP